MSVWGSSSPERQCASWYPDPQFDLKLYTNFATGEDCRNLTEREAILSPDQVTANVQRFPDYY